MNIDLNKFKTIWFELEDGTEVDEVPKDYKGYVSFWSAFPCQFTESMYSYIYRPRTWYEKLLVKIRPQLKEKWNVTKGRTYRPAHDFRTTYTGMSDVIVAMVDSGDYTLEQAIWICAKSCERCMNVLSDKYLGRDGYAEFSEEWNRCNTVCLFCEDLEEQSNDR